MAQFLKIPIAKLGSWFHETHGVVSFSGDDLRALETNFRVNARGYEPYLKTGHNEKGPGIYDDEKAEAHLVDMLREGDTLFGLFEPHGDEIVADVTNQKYRYASAELIRSAKDRQTGKPIAGPILRGVSLTNAPSIPNLPRNSLVETDSLSQMLSDELVREVHTIRLSPNDGAFMSTTTEKTADELAAEATAAAEKAAAEATPAATSEEIKGMFQNFLESVKAILTPAAKAVEQTADEIAADAAALAAAAEKEAAELETEAKAALLEVELAAAKEAAALAQAAKEAAEAAQAAAEAKATELEAEKAEADAAKAVAEAAAAEAQAEADRVAAEAQAASEAAAAAEITRKEGEYAQMLSDRVATCVSAGVPPLEAAKAKELVLALRGSVTTLMLSDKEEPVNLEDAVFELLSDRVGTIDFGQVGAVDPQAGNAHQIPASPAAKGMSPANPWATRFSK